MIFFIKICNIHNLINLHDTALDNTYIFSYCQESILWVKNKTINALQNSTHTKERHHNIPEGKEDNSRQCKS